MTDAVYLGHFNQVASAGGHRLMMASSHYNMFEMVTTPSSLLKLEVCGWLSASC
jgi:hypothetical protein